MLNIFSHHPTLPPTYITETLFISLLVFQQTFSWREQEKPKENYSIVNRIRIYNKLCNIVILSLF